MQDLDAEKFMAMALQEALIGKGEGEVPVGAVLVSADGRVIARDHNRNIQLNDPTAHAEILVLRKGGEALGNYRLTRTYLFVTLEPCPMCAGAIVHARVDKVFIGARDEKTGACGSVFNITGSPFVNHRPEVTFGLLEDECSRILKEFFQDRR